MAKGKRQHFVQRAHIETWSEREYQGLYCCDLLTGKIYEGPASSMAHQDYYYSFIDPETGEKCNEIDRFITYEIENKGLPAIRKLANGQPISLEEKNTIADYIAYQKTRVPAFEAATNKVKINLDKVELLRIIKNEKEYQKFLGDYNSRYEGKKLPIREELIRTIEEGRIDMSYGRSLSLSAMPHVSQTLAERYRQAKWSLLESPSKRSYLISDNPAVTISLQDRVTQQIHTETTFPLSPKIILLINDQISSGKVYTAQEDIKGVRELNRRIIIHASRFLYSGSKQLLEWAYKEKQKLEVERDLAVHFSDETVVIDNDIFIKRNFI